MAERIVSGREFQILGAVTRKARAAVVVDVLGRSANRHQTNEVDDWVCRL